MLREHEVVRSIRTTETSPLVAEMADATVSEAVADRHARSTRAEGTIFNPQESCPSGKGSAC